MGSPGRLRWKLYAARENKFLFSGETDPTGSPGADAGEELEQKAQEYISGSPRGMQVRDGDEFRLEVFDEGGRFLYDQHYLFRIGIYGSLEPI